MKSLIVGMGFGNAVYRPVLESMGATVVTVDPVKPADFENVQQAVAVHSHFDTVNICTPNFTHEAVARQVAEHSNIVFVEKPGVADSAAWHSLVDNYPATRFMMVKNNQYRDEIEYFRSLADQSTGIDVIWNNQNRIPNPGSWFTTRNLAYGGVSRDLIPHMLSYYCVLTDFAAGVRDTVVCEQRHQLQDIVDTDYGTVNPLGTFDVDDHCALQYTNNNVQWNLIADWKSEKFDDVCISFRKENNSVTCKLGLCPESAYKSMIETAVNNINNNQFWIDQLIQDLWIHRQIETL